MERQGYAAPNRKAKTAVLLKKSFVLAAPTLAPTAHKMNDIANMAANSFFKELDEMEPLSTHHSAPHVQSKTTNSRTASNIYEALSEDNNRKSIFCFAPSTLVLSTAQPKVNTAECIHDDDEL